MTAAVSVPGIRAVELPSGSDVAFPVLVQRALAADVVFFGENHDDPETHRVELGLLDAIGRSGRPVILSLEMFERDAQSLLNDYLANRITEADFLARARPWDRYVTDYRPMVELAKANGWPVVASNIPRPMASAVGRRGLAALDTLTAAERSWAARDIQCHDDPYRARFMETMRGHSSGGAAPSAADTLPTAAATRFYLAQCIKDETMAESIVEARRRSPNAIIIHYDGAFHSDYRQGTVDRVRRRSPDLRMLVITAVPVIDLTTATLASHAGRADFIVFTKRIPPKPPVPPRPEEPAEPFNAGKAGKQRDFAAQDEHGQNHLPVQRINAEPANQRRQKHKNLSAVIRDLRADSQFRQFVFFCGIPI